MDVPLVPAARVRRLVPYHFALSFPTKSGVQTLDIRLRGYDIGGGSVGFLLRLWRFRNPTYLQ
ncbi:MAG: hypothetical protein WAU88_02965 [Candidatus Zixiibacteriota bacterium]